MDLAAVRGFMGVGMVPVLGGDMVHDSLMGFSVGSGDQVAVILAKELGASDLVLATDVAGVYDADPKANPDARLVRELSLTGSGDLAGAGDARKDASGAMRGKLSALAALSPELHGGLNMAIISMMEPGRLRALLRGDPVDATRIKP
jgi:isopentenyl phosphate kinase